MDKQRLHRLMVPKSIAVFGAKGADFAIRESQKLGFAGPIYAVHPKRLELAGISCLKSATELPEAPDAAYVAVNADAAIGIVRQLRQMGAGGAVLYASGFSEVGGVGIKRQQQLLEAAGDMPIIGPNCYGVINALDKAVLWPDQHGLSSVNQGVGIITQSGNIGLNMTMQKVGLPIAYMFTVGNQAQANIATIIDAMLDDSRVNAIGLHIEGINDLSTFDQAARRALEQKIPIVAIKSGRTQIAAKIALSHTSSLTGADQLFDALFQRLGIVRVNTLPTFMETLKLLSLLGPIANSRIASMSCSGGEAGMMADLIDATDLTFPALTDAQTVAIKATLNDYVEVANPLDYHTFIWGDREAMAQTFAAMMAAKFSATLLLLDWPNYPNADFGEWDTALLALADAAKAGNHQTILLSSMAECLPAHAIDMCHQHEITPMIGLDTCLQALDHAHKVYQAFHRSLPLPLEMRFPSGQQANTSLSEYVAKQTLAKYGLVIPKGGIANSAHQALALAEHIGFPITLKAVADNIVHKTELDAVRLNIQNSQQVMEAYQHLFTISQQVLVESMITDVLAEMIIGVNTDPLFGNYLVIGAGGILVELIKDNQLLLMPCQPEDVQLALNKLAMQKLLQGYRGQPIANQQKIIDAIMSVVAFVKQSPMAEIDINPLLVKADICVAVDALICKGS